MSRPSHYRGRFAPSPTGALHAGSLVAALASWLDARAHRGAWLVRIEDVDTPRCIAGADHTILQQLHACGLAPDEPPVWQSQRTALYQQALRQLQDAQMVYPCACTRKDIEAALQHQGLTKPRHGELVYPGTCREGPHGRTGRACRLHCTRTVATTSSPQPLAWTDRRLGPQQQDVATDVGDFVLLRADGLFAYQLAVVVDDAAQGISHVVRGEDLADNTARQILLQRALGVPTPAYLHAPLVRDALGEKLSKQSGAQAVDVSDPMAALNAAAQVLGLPEQQGTVQEALAAWTVVWAQAWAPPLGRT